MRKHSAAFVYSGVVERQKRLIQAERAALSYIHASPVLSKTVGDGALRDDGSRGLNNGERTTL